MILHCIQIFEIHRYISIYRLCFKGLSEVYRGYVNEREVFPLVLAGKAVYLESRGFAEFHLAMKYTHGGESTMRFMKVSGKVGGMEAAVSKHCETNWWSSVPDSVSVRTFLCNKYYLCAWVIN